VRQTLLSKFHDSPLRGHFGVDKTLAAMQQYFYWPNMVNDIRLYISTCDFCQKNKPSNTHYYSHWIFLITCGRASTWTSLHSCLKQSKDTMLCSWSLTGFPRWWCSFPQVTAAGAATLYFEHVFKNFGMPESIVSDRDVRFTGRFWRELHKCTGTVLRMSTAYHPQTDGLQADGKLTERVNRTVEQMLSNFVNERADDWDKHLAAAQFTINSSQQASIKKTPFQLLYGWNPRTPAALLQNNDTVMPEVNNFLNIRAADLTAAKRNMEAQKRQAKHPDSSRRDGEFRVGDAVLVSTEHSIQNEEPVCGTFQNQEVIQDGI